MLCVFLHRQYERNAEPHRFATTIALSILVFVPIFGLLQSARAQSAAEPVRWQFSYEMIDDSVLVIVAKATLDAGWRLFAPDANPNGCVPLELTLQESEDYEAVGKFAAQRTPLEEFDSLQNIYLLCFRQEIEFRQQVKLHSTQRIALVLNVFGQSCNPALKMRDCDD